MIRVVVDLVSDWCGAIVTTLNEIIRGASVFHSPAHMKDDDDDDHKLMSS